MSEILASPILTPRLILREYTESDFDGVHAYAADPETVKFMTWGPNNPQQTREFIQLAISQASMTPRINYHFVIALRNSQQIIGGCGIHLRQPQHRGAEIGYCFHKAFWGQGYGTEAAGALIQFGFESLKLHRIAAFCDVLNIGSARVMQKNHMRHEGHFLQNRWQKEQWRDTLLYAILEQEWSPRSPSK